MKVIILAGGFGTRLSEYTEIIPKPMVKINNKEILLRIINIYKFHGFEDFYIALGYKSEFIKEFFGANKSNIIQFRVGSGNVNIHLIDTGIDSMTGGRVKLLQEYIGNETFMLTYGDGVSDINITDLVDFHKHQKKMVTVTAVRPPARFGAIKLDGNKVVHFEEKSQLNEGWINGGFFVIEPKFFDYISEPSTVLERQPLETVASEGELIAYLHKGFWQCMDTKRDKDILEENARKSDAPWAYE